MSEAKGGRGLPFQRDACSTWSRLNRHPTGCRSFRNGTSRPSIRTLWTLKHFGGRRNKIDAAFKSIPVDFSFVAVRQPLRYTLRSAEMGVCSSSDWTSNSSSNPASAMSRDCPINRSLGSALEFSQPAVHLAAISSSYCGRRLRLPLNFSRGERRRASCRRKRNWLSNLARRSVRPLVDVCVNGDWFLETSMDTMLRQRPW